MYKIRPFFNTTKCATLNNTMIAIFVKKSLMYKLIFLIGYMGSGKTTAGKKLAKKLNLDFIDIDQAISEMSGCSISEIFERNGEEAFRQLEHAVLKSLCQRKNLVVATGGGTPCFFDNMNLMNRYGMTVYLQMHPRSLASRLIESKDERPLLKSLSNEELPEYIANHLSSRERFYLKSKIVMKGENLNQDKLIQFIKDY